MFSPTAATEGNVISFEYVSEALTQPTWAALKKNLVPFALPAQARKDSA
jgi:hypothetical protein